MLVQKRWMKARPGAVIELKQSSGAAAFSLSASQISEAAACFRRLDGLASLTAAVSYFLKHANPAGGRRSLDEVAKEFLKSREAMGVRSRTLTQYESYLRTISERFVSLAIHEVRRGGKLRTGYRNRSGPSEPATTTSARFLLSSSLLVTGTIARRIRQKRYLVRFLTMRRQAF